MKVSTAEQTTLRTFPQASKWYLGFQRGLNLLTAQIDGDHAAGATELLLKNVVCDDTTELRRGMTVSISLISNNDRHTDAVFLHYDPYTLTLTIGSNNTTALNNHYVTIYSKMTLWKMTPRPFDSQHLLPFPIVGSPRAGFVNEPIAFLGANSYSPVGRALSDPRWKFFGGHETLVSGSLSAFNTAGSPLVMTWDAPGEYMLRFRCEDSLGEVGRTFRPILMFDRSGANAPYEQFRINSCAWRGGGWSANITLYGVADQDEVPTEALMVLWAEDWYAGVKGSIGGQLRGESEVLFTGWVRGGSVRMEADEHSVTFDVDSVDTLAGALAMDDYTFRDGDDTTDWLHFANLTSGKAALHLLQQRTTLPLMADVFCASFNYQQDRIDVPQGKLLTQLQQSIMQNCTGYVAGSRFCSLTLSRDRNYATALQRGELKNTSISLSSADWLSFVPTEDRFAGYAQVRLEGRDGQDNLIAGVYPTTGPAHSGDILVLSNYFFKDQAQADELAFAVWRVGNRRIQSCHMELPNYRMLEPAFQEYFNAVLPSAENNRGYNWVSTLNGATGREFLCVGMAINFHEEGFITVSIDGKNSTYGPNGLSWDVPDPLPVLEDVPGYDQNPSGGETGTD